MSRLPRAVKIVVHDGRNLDYRVVGSKKSPQTRKWRVIFIGGEKKQATGIVDEQDGFPRWDCEVLIAPPKPVDNVRMLVLDGKEREVGQVVINLLDFWPPSPPPSLVTSQLHVRELQATKHNPTPCGQLSFWIWATDYWPEGTVPIAGSSGGHSAKQAIRGSFSHLGAALKSSQHGSVAASQSGVSGEVGDGHSRLGGKFRDIKNRSRENRSGASNVSASGIQNHQSQPDEGSVLMGASIISSHAGLAPTVGGWTSAASELTGGMAVESNLVNGGGNYNPLGSPEQDERETYGGLGRPSSMFVAGGGGMINGDDVWNTPAANFPPSSSAQPSIREGKGRRRHMVSQLKSKLSRSSANLSEIGHKMRSKRPSPDGGRCDQDSRDSAISSKSRGGGARRKISSIFSHFRHDRKSKDIPDGFQSCIDLRQFMPLDEPAMNETPPSRRRDTRPIVRHSESSLEPNAQYSGDTVKEEWGLPSTQPQPTSMTPAPNLKSNGNTAAYGLHPEEGPGKAKDDMTKRELIELTSVLEQRLLATRTELVRANMEQNHLSARVEELNSELTQTRLQLSTLRSRLLEDNLTQYLEVSIVEGSPVRPPPRGEHLTTFQSPNASPPGATARSPENSFLSKARALATRSFGGGILSNATSQPNLSSTGINGQSSFSPPSPSRNGVIDYGSANRKSVKRKFPPENDYEENFVGRKKKSLSEDKGRSDEIIQRYSIYPLVRRKSGSGESENLHVFTATLLSIDSSPAKVAVIEAKSDSQLKEIEILQRMGCYGYSPENGGKCQSDKSPTELFLFDAEMFFLHHGLGVLKVAIPRSSIKNLEEKSPIDHLWNILTASTNQNSVPPLAPFPIRYAAYVYYRSRGWIVRPSLNLGGVDFLLYAESPDLRHAAFAVIVVPSSTNRSICDFTAHLRVASSVAKKLIIAKVYLPENHQTETEPWNQIKHYSIEETLVSRPDIV